MAGRRSLACLVPADPSATTAAATSAVNHEHDDQDHNSECSDNQQPSVHGDHLQRRWCARPRGHEPGGAAFRLPSGAWGTVTPSDHGQHPRLLRATPLAPSGELPFANHLDRPAHDPSSGSAGRSTTRLVRAAAGRRGRGAPLPAGAEHLACSAEQAHACSLAVRQSSRHATPIRTPLARKPAEHGQIDTSDGTVCQIGHNELRT